MSFDAIVGFINAQPMLGLFAIIAAGTLLGSLRIRSVTLNSTAVLLVALLAGHLQITLPDAVTQMGVVLFSYATGLQAGPRFLRAFRRRGAAFVLVTITMLGSAVAICAALAWAIRLPAPMAAGILCGALTSTPALASTLEVLRDPLVTVGYGVTYPFGVMGAILFVQLVPRLLRVDLRAEAARADSAAKSPPVALAWFRVQNPLIQGRTLADIAAHRVTDTLISRVNKGGVTYPALDDLVVECGDHVRAVGPEHELEPLELLFGPRVPDYQEASSQVTSITLVVTEPQHIGRKLSELQLRERYSINISRIWRDDLEFVPHSYTTLEFGDTIRIVGNRGDCESFALSAGHQEERLHETQFVPLTLGLLAGVLLGFLTIPLPGGLSVSLGLACGPLLTGLVAGHFGRIGQLIFRVPLAAKYFIRELGLMFFVAGVGVAAGRNFWPVLQQHGAVLLLVGAAVTLTPLAAAFGVARLALRWDVLTTMGALCGAMTCTPALGSVARLSRSQAASLAYVAVYPTALIGKTVLAPLVGILLRHLPSCLG